MPTPELMTWIASQRRWTIQYMGRRYYVSCRQLGIKPETKETSIQAANAWWREKQASLDLAYRANQQARQRTPAPGEDLGTATFGGGPWTSTDAIAKAVARALDSPPPKELEPIAHQIIKWIQNEPTDSRVWERFAELVRDVFYPAVVKRTIIDGEGLPAEVREGLPAARTAQVERGQKEYRGEQAAEQGRTVKTLVEKWMLALKSQEAIGVISAARLRFIKITLGQFAAFLGETADVSTINAESLEGFYHFCLNKIANQEWSRSYAKEIFTSAKQWINWLVERGAVPLPTNFRRKWRFGPSAKPIEIWPLEDVRRLIPEARGKLRLCLLLMLNCGMTQKDVSDLADDEVNWREGRIVRKRSKTRGHEEVPIVNYKLWPSTFALLKECRSGQERVLLTSKGTPFVNKRMVNGKCRAVDLFGTRLWRVMTRLGIKRPLKQLRKTSATLLENHTVTLPSGETVNPYANCVSLFLGHSPKSMKDRHYAAPPQALFDAAITWLGEQLGVAE